MSSVRVGDLCIFRRSKQLEYSSTYVDMSIDSYKEIGVFANYFARFEQDEDEKNDFILFQHLDLVFSAGYLSTENCIGTINETSVVTSNHTDITFAIPLDSISSI